MGPLWELARFANDLGQDKDQLKTANLLAALSNQQMLQLLQARALQQSSRATQSLPQQQLQQQSPLQQQQQAPQNALTLQQLHNLYLSRSEEHTSELQSLMRLSYAVFCLKKKKSHTITPIITSTI